MSEKKEELSRELKLLNAMSEIYDKKVEFTSLVTFLKERGLHKNFSVIMNREKLVRKENNIIIWNNDVRPNIRTAKALCDKKQRYDTETRNRSRSGKSSVRSITRTTPKAIVKIPETVDLDSKELSPATKACIEDLKEKVSECSKAPSEVRTFNHPPKKIKIQDPTLNLKVKEVPCPTPTRVIEFKAAKKTRWKRFLSWLEF